MAQLFHITSVKEWLAAQSQGEFITSSLAKEGFIHCSLAQQVLGVANFKYRDRTDLILLEIDENKVKEPVKYEDLYNLNEDYPHIYGPLNLDAVVRILPFLPTNDGIFQLPKELGD